VNSKVVIRLENSPKRSVVAEERRSLAILKDYPVGIEQPEATDRVERWKMSRAWDSGPRQTVVQFCPVRPAFCTWNSAVMAALPRISPSPGRSKARVPLDVLSACFTTELSRFGEITTHVACHVPVRREAICNCCSWTELPDGQQDEERLDRLPYAQNLLATYDLRREFRAANNLNLRS
jgi:hypothetical protein